MKKIFTLLFLIGLGLSIQAQNGCQAYFTYAASPYNSMMLFDASGSGTMNTTSWFWDFGDGSSSSIQNPEHVFASGYQYLVCLTIAGDSCSSTYCDTIMVGQSTDSCQGFMVYAMSNSTGNPNGTPGSVFAEVWGGTMPYTYLWDDGSMTNEITNPLPGTYCITVTDAVGCTSVSCADVVAEDTTWVDSCGIYVDAIVVNASGPNAMDGIAELMVDGGTPPYVFYWSTGATTQNLTNAAPGFYTVTIYDYLQCSVTYTVIVGDDSSTPCTFYPYISYTVPTSPGNCDGTASVFCDNTGTSNGFSYLWENGADSPSITGLCEGSYCVTVTSADGCSAIDCAYLYSDDSVITNTCYLYLDYSITNVSASGAADGAIDVTVYGGTPPYAYSWANGSGTPSLSSLPAGTYTFSVVDVNGCSESITVFVGMDSPVNPVDTLWTDPVDTCIIITDFYVDSVNVMDSNYVNVIWAIVSTNGTSYFTVTYPYNQTGYVVIYLTFNCQGGAKSLTVVSGIIQVDYSMILGITTPVEFGNITLFPNPVHNSLNIKLENTVSSKLYVEIFSMTGQKVYSQEINDFNGQNTLNINTENLQKGFYTVRLNSVDGVSSVGKFIK